MRREEEYWKERAEENARRVFRYSQRRAELVTRWFGQAEREMREKILAFYRRYAEQEQITLQQAKAALNDPRAQRLTLEEARRLAEQYPEDPVIQKLLQTDYLRRSVSREELLIQQLNLLASELYGEYAQELHKSLSEIFEEGYYRAIYDQQQYAGFGQNFDTLNVNQIEAAVTTAWQGKSYSERLWGDHRVSLARYLNRIVTTGVIRGSSGAQMTAQLQKAMGMGAYEARRLIRTECCQVSNRAAVLGYRQCGTGRYQFLATLDYQTSEICRGLDGQVFDVSEAVPGKNMPPMHPFCRSTTIPYWPDEEFDEGTTRAARNGRGETYRVPASMTYRQWYDQYVKPNPEELLAEKMIRNGGKDAKQWEQYTSLLGKDAPESLDKFQRIKYTDPKAWDDLKAFARYKRSYPHSDRSFFEIDREIQSLREQGLVVRSIGIAVAPQPRKIESYKTHALDRMLERGFSAEDADRIISGALVEFRQFKGARSAYFSLEGSVTIERGSNEMVTGWPRTNSNEGSERILEVLKKHGKW